MKKINKSALACFVLFMAVLLGFCACDNFDSWSENINPTSFISGDFTYSLNPDGTITLTKYSGKETTLTIPDSIEELSVSALGDEFFSALTTITSITVNSTTPPALPVDALANCTSLAVIYVPDGSYAVYVAADSWSAYSSYIVVSEGTITFNANSESAAGSMEPLVIAGGTSVPLTACGFSINGYTFAGWAAASDATAVEYADGAEYKMVSGSVTLYALWTEASLVPAAPTGVSASFISSTGTAGTVKVTWTDASSDETTFVVYRQASSDTSATELASVDADVTEYTDTTAVRGTTYTYSVSGKNSFGESDRTEGSSITIPTLQSISASASYPSAGTITFLDSSGNAISGNTTSLAKGSALKISVKENFSSYQWYLDGAALTGETAQSLSLSTSSWSAGVHAVTVMTVDSSGDEFSGVLSVNLTN